MKNNINTEERLRIGNTIKSLRNKLGLSQRQLADKSGLSHEHICAIENGKYNAGIDTLSAIASALDSKLDII